MWAKTGDFGYRHECARNRPNGGGNRVNEYTLIYDVLTLPGDAMASFSCVNLDTAGDGDVFWRCVDGGLGQGEVRI